MKKFAVILIFLLFASYSPSSAYKTDEIEWAPAVEAALYKGDTLTNGPYMVKAVQFPSPVQGYKNLKGEILPDTLIEPMVYLELYKDNNFLKEVLLSNKSGAELDPDYEFMISGKEFLPANSRDWVLEYYKPWAKVAISLRGKPGLYANISTEKGIYTSGSDHIITARVEIKNNGDAVAENVDVILNTADLNLRGGPEGQLHQVYNELKKGESKSFEVVLIVPDLLDQKTYNLTVDTKGIDVKDLEYRSTGQLSITVSPRQNFFTLGKSVTKNRIYLNDITIVKLNIANTGTQEMNNIIINDSINPDFELRSNTTLLWNIPVIRPGEWKDIQYTLKPLETSLSGFTFPAANAEFTVNGKQYNISSDAPVVLVNGPKIILNKTVDKQIVNINDDVTVTVSIKNIGNVQTRIEVKDFLPENVSLINGSTSLDPTFLELNTPAGFNYTIRMNTWENIELPAAVANYTGVEYRGMTRSAVRSERPVITLINLARNTSIPALTPNVPEGQSGAPSDISDASDTSDASQAAPSETEPVPITPGLNIIFGIFVLIFTAVFMRK